MNGQRDSTPPPHRADDASCPETRVTFTDPMPRKARPLATPPPIPSPKLYQLSSEEQASIRQQCTTLHIDMSRIMHLSRDQVLEGILRSRRDQMVQIEIGLTGSTAATTFDEGIEEKGTGLFPEKNGVKAYYLQQIRGWRWKVAIWGSVGQTALVTLWVVSYQKTNDAEEAYTPIAFTLLHGVTILCFGIVARLRDVGIRGLIAEVKESQYWGSLLGSLSLAVELFENHSSLEQKDPSPALIVLSMTIYSTIFSHIPKTVHLRSLHWIGIAAAFSSYLLHLAHLCALHSHAMNALMESLPLSMVLGILYAGSNQLQTRITEKRPVALVLVWMGLFITFGTPIYSVCIWNDDIFRFVSQDWSIPVAKAVAVRALYPTLDCIATAYYLFVVGGVGLVASCAPFYEMVDVIMACFYGGSSSVFLWVALAVGIFAALVFHLQPYMMVVVDGVTYMDDIQVPQEWEDQLAKNFDV